MVACLAYELEGTIKCSCFTSASVDTFLAASHFQIFLTYSTTRQISNNTSDTTRTYDARLLDDIMVVDIDYSYTQSGDSEEISELLDTDEMLAERRLLSRDGEISGRMSFHLMTMNLADRKQ